MAASKNHLYVYCVVTTSGLAVACFQSKKGARRYITWASKGGYFHYKHRRVLLFP